jgi:lysophospholipase L1-like esterase
MHKTILFFIALSFLLQVSPIAKAQQAPPFWEEIVAFKKQDSTHFPQKNAILFVGSSSFRKWTDVQQYFPGYAIINRGFGGSSLPDVIRYADDIIYPYHPKQVVIYCGDNDLAASDTVTSYTILSRFTSLFNMIRKKLPEASIVFVSIKPSPSRQKLMSRMDGANMLVKNFLKDKPHTGFVDVYHQMLTAKGEPIKELFLEDNLHMNAKGYAIWQKAIRPFLLKP